MQVAEILILIPATKKQLFININTIKWIACISQCGFFVLNKAARHSERSEESHLAGRFILRKGLDEL